MNAGAAFRECGGPFMNAGTAGEGGPDEGTPRSPYPFCRE